MTFLSLLLACSQPPFEAVPAGEVDVEQADAVDYEAARQRLSAERERLAASRAGRSEAEVLEEAREVVFRALVDDLIPSWHGTKWAFYGTSTTPGEGEIACGYYVSTLLQHADFDVERVRLAQQASENIIKTFTARSDIHRFSNRPARDVVDRVQREGRGIYVLGLDYHAALLVNDGDTVQMCHASYLGEGRALCEPALTSAAMVSNYRVVGKLLSNDMMRKWLEGEGFATVR